MSKFKYYLLFNPELKELNLKELNDNYLKDLITNDKITSIESFFKKYPTFDINKYKVMNKQFSKKPIIDILISVYLNEYKNKIYNDTQFHKDLYKTNILKDDIPQIISFNNLEFKIKLAHIFVHFFKIGGGESYISNFNKYNTINCVFNETIFINNNYLNETLFKYNCKIVYYKDYKELNKLLKDYDIIIDHQLYWFDVNITKESFLKINQNKIIRIIHGVPIHFKDITEYDFYYSIELYKEPLSHISWNKHIKIYNNIGVKQHINIAKIFDKDNIKIALVGRINIEKIPILFLKILIPFLNIYKQYKFNFYGLIEDSYSIHFLNYINKSVNITYYDVIEPDFINNIYENNDILIHPSKFEAGATVILEAMSYGLPVICRNIGGLPNAVGINNSTFLCNTEKEMFEKLLTINDYNYNIISNNNILKVYNENNEEIVTKNLINIIKNIHDYEIEDNKIPNIIHYIFGLKEQTEEFEFVYFLSIYSNFVINKPDVIYFHYQYLPYGYWWDEAKKYIKLNYVNVNDLYWGNKRIIKYAHKSDKLRLDILFKYGGIYMDIDTITYRPYKDLLKYNFVIGIQEENYGINKITLYCNAILLSKKNNIFIKKWINEYESIFDPDGWCEASVHLPYNIFNKLSANDKSNIKILEKECFYYPSYNETEKIFENNNNIHDKLITLHLWNTFSEKYYKNIKNFDWCNNNESLYSKLIINLSNLFLTT